MTTRQHPFFPIPVFETVLPNGLTLITAQTPSQFVHANIVFAAGSYDDGANPGAAHFLEHLLYEGAARDGIHPKLRHLYPKGIKANGGTEEISTAYWIDGYVPDFRAMLEALFSIVFTFDCTAMHVDRERSVILQEFDENHNPEDLLLWERQTFFPDVPALYCPPIGTRASVEGMTIEALQGFFERFYTSSNAALIVTGDMAHEEVQRIVCDALQAARISNGHEPRPRRTIIEPRFCRATRHVLMRPSVLTLSFPAALGEEEDFLLGLVYDLLVHFPFGVLSKKMRFEDRLVYGISSGVSAWPKPYNYLEIGAAPDRFAYLEEAVFNGIERFIAGEYDGDLWGAVMHDRKRFFDERREAPRGAFDAWIQEQWLVGQDPNFDAEGVLARVTRECLVPIARKYLSRERYGCLSVVRV